MKLSLQHTTIQPTKDVIIHIKGKLESTIYLMAFDKHYTDINDISQDVVQGRIENYETDTNHIIQNMSDWHNCSEDEIKRVTSKRVLYFPHYYETIDIESSDGNREEQTVIKQNHISNKAEIMNENYLEPWLFEEIEVTKTTNKVSKQFKVPNIQATWIISAFMVNERNGLVIAKPQELKFESEFFLEMIQSKWNNLEETRRLDILVHNYLKNKQNLNVTVALDNRIGSEYEIVEHNEYRNKCLSTTINENTDSRKIFIPYGMAKEISFCIKPKNTQEKLFNRLKIRVLAKGFDASNNKYGEILNIFLL